MSTHLIAALNKAVLEGDRAEVDRLMGLFSPTEGFVSAQDEMDELLGPESSIDELKARYPGRTAWELEDWQITYRAWLYKSIKGLEAGPMPPSAPLINAAD